MKFLFLVEVPWCRDESLIENLKLFSGEFGLNFFKGSLLVGVVDVDVVGLYVVGDGRVMGHFIELGLAGVAMECESKLSG